MNFLKHVTTRNLCFLLEKGKMWFLTITLPTPTTAMTQPHLETRIIEQLRNAPNRTKKVRAADFEATAQQFGMYLDIMVDSKKSVALLT